MNFNFYKKSFLVSWLIGFCTLAFAQSITILNPAPLSVLNGCEPYQVVWTTTGTVNTIHVEFSVNGGATWKSLASFAENRGSQAIVIPSVASTSNYVLRVRDSFNSSIASTVGGITISNTGVGRLRFTAPISYSGRPLSYRPGDGFSISYNLNEVCTSEIEIWLSTNGGVDFNVSVVGKTLTAQGSYYYTVPNGINSKDCYLKIIDAGNPSNFDISERIEITSSAPFFTVLSFPGGQTFKACERIQIPYRGNASTTYTVEYTKVGSGVWSQGVNVWGDSYGGTQNFTLNIGTVTGQMQLRYYPVGNVSASVLGSTFDVVAGNPSINITSPAGTREFYQGTSMFFSYVAPCSQFINLDLSADGGSTWVNYINAQFNTGNLGLTVPNSLSGVYLAKIYDKDNPSVQAVTEVTLLPRLVTILSTTTGFQCAGAYTLRWITQGMEYDNSFRIEYSTNGGVTYQLVTDNYYSYPTLKQYTWNMPSTLLGTVQVRITEVNTSISGIASFNIGTPSPQISDVSYSSGTQWPCDYGINITGTSCGYNIYLTPDDGNTLHTLAINYTQTYLWVTSFPGTLTGIPMKVLVRDTFVPTASVLGSNTVTFNPLITISGVFPNSGTYQGGSDVSISWTRPLCRIPEVKVEITTNAGVSFVTLADNVKPNSFFTKFPNVSATGARFRISSMADPTISVLGGAFNINPTPAPGIITITSALTTLTSGNYYSLTFTRTDDTGLQVIIELSHDNGFTWTRAATNYVSGFTASTGFTVPIMPNSTQARMRISYRDNANVRFVSQNFVITNFTNFSSFSLSGDFVEGADVYAYFSPGSSNIPFVDFEVSTNGGVSFISLYKSIRNQSYLVYNNPGLQSSNAIFRIASSSNPTINRTVSGALLTSPNITVTSVSATATACQNANIQFLYINNNGFNFHIDYSEDGGTTWRRHINNVYISGYPTYSYNFQVPSVDVSKNLRFRVYPITDASKAGLSTNMFVTADNSMGIAISRPSASSLLAAGSNENIEWVMTGGGCNFREVKVEYSLNGGVDFKTIRSNYSIANNNGTLGWYVPNGSFTNQAQVRITNVGNPVISATSSNFTITGPYISLSIPGVTNYNAYTMYNVNWGGQPSGGTSYYVFYSTNGGSSWTYLNSVYIYSSGQYSGGFTAPNVTSTTSAILGLDRTYSTGAGMKEYMTNFTITAPNIVMSTPGPAAMVATGPSLTTNVSFSFTGWTSGQTMYPYYIYNDDDLTAVRITSFSYFFSGDGTNSFTWTLPTGITTITSTKIAWGNSTSWSSSSRKIYGHNFNLLPPVNNVTTVLATNFIANSCQGTVFVITFGGSGTFNAGNVFSVELASSAGSPVGSGIIIGSITSTATSGVITVTSPTTGYSGTWVVRVLSSNPQILNTANLKHMGVTFSSSTCITLNSNSALNSLPGLGFVDINGNLAYQLNSTFNVGNQFIVQLSDENGNFGSPITIGSVTTHTGPGTIPITISHTLNLPTSSNYRIRVVSTNPVRVSSLTQAFTINNAFIDVWSVGGNNFCPGKQFPVVFDAEGDFNPGNQFRVELSNSAGNFPTNNFIGVLNRDTDGYDIVAIATVPSSISTSFGYRVRVQSTNPFSNTSAGYESPAFAIFANCMGNVTFSGGPYFSGDPLQITVIPNTTFNGGNVYIAQLSDAFGSFASPTFMGSATGVSNTMFTVTIPAIAAQGNNYNVRIITTQHPSTSLGYFLGTVSPLRIQLSNAMNSSAFCPGAYMKMGDMTVTGNVLPGNVYTVQMNDVSTSTFSTPRTLFTFTASGTGIISIPGFLIPTTVLSNGFTRSVRVVSSSPVAISQNIVSGLTYYNNCFSSITPSATVVAPNEGYTLNYVVQPGIILSPTNQMVAEISGNAFTTLLGLNSIVSSVSGAITFTIPGTLPTGSYRLRVSSTDFPANSDPATLALNQVNIKISNWPTLRTHCQGGAINMDNLITVLSAVNAGNNYIIQVSPNMAFSPVYDILSIPSTAMGVINTGMFTVPVNSLMGFTNYYYRVVSTHPYAVSGNISGNTNSIRPNCVQVTSVSPSSVCPNGNINALFDMATFNASNQFTLELSNELGAFTSPLLLGTQVRSLAGSNIPFNVTLPSGLPQSTSYRVRVLASDFAAMSAPSGTFEIKQVCIGEPGGVNTMVNQCSFLPIVTVAATGTVEPDNEYKLYLTNNSGTIVSLLGTVMSGSTGVITFENVPLPASITGLHRLQVFASSPNTAGSLMSSNFNIITNCLAAPYFPQQKICSGTPYTTTIYLSTGNTMNPGNQFIVELSNASGSFASPTTVFSTASTANTLFAVITIPSNMPTGTGYKLRVRTTNPANTSNDGNIFSIDQICLTPGFVAVGPYLGGVSPITITAITVGSVLGGNTFMADLVNSSGTVVSSGFASSASATFTGTVPTVATGGYYNIRLRSTNPVATSSLSNAFIVNPTRIDIGEVAGSYCVGSTVMGINFTVTGSVGVGNQYAVDLSDVNGNFFSFTNLGSIADATTGVKTINAVIPIGLPTSNLYRIRIRATSNGSISDGTPININSTFLWTGAASTAWDNVNNWSCPLVPTSGIDVLIPTLSGSNYPVINIANAMGRNITVNQGATLELASNGILSIYGNLVVNGTFNAHSLSGVSFTGPANTSHDVLGNGSITFGLITVPGLQYVNVRHNVTVLNNYYNYGFTYNYSTLGVNNVLYNYNRLDAYNTINVINRFVNNLRFNVYNNFVANPIFNFYGYFENNSSLFNAGVSDFRFNGSNTFIEGSVAPTFYNIVNNSTNLVLNNNINVYVGYTNNGLFNGLGRSVTFIPYGTLPTVIAGSGYSNFGSVIFNNTYGVNLSANIGVQNDFINLAGFTPGTSVVSFTGNGIQNISGTGIGNITFNGFNVAQTTSDINITNDILVQGSVVNRGRIRNTNVTTFDAAAPQTITGIGQTILRNVVNRNTTGLTILTPVVVDGNLRNEGVLQATASTLSFTGTNQTISGTVTPLLGGVETDAATTLEVKQDIEIQGSVVNRGRVRATNTEVVLSGSTPQTFVSQGETVLNTVRITNTVNTVTLQGGFEIDGNIVNNGTLNANAAVITTAGSSLQSITGTNTVEVGTLINNNMAGIVVTQPIEVSGNVVARTGRVRATQALVLDGSASQSVSGTQVVEVNNLVVNNTTNIIVNAPLELKGNIQTQADIDASNTVVSLTGVSTVQTISGSKTMEVGGLVNNSTQGTVITAPLRVEGNIVNNADFVASNTVTFAETSSTISGTNSVVVNDVVVAPSGSVTSTRPVRVRGDITNNAGTSAIGSQSAAIVLEGSSTQVVGGSSDSFINQLVVLNNSGVELQQSVSSNAVTLAGGNVVVDANEKLAITSTLPSAITRTTDAYIEGTLSRNIAQTNAAYEFPVGTDDAYRGAVITFTGATNTSLEVKASKDVPINNNPTANNGAPLALFEPSLNDSLKVILPGSVTITNSSPSTTGTYDIQIEMPVTLPGYTNPSELVMVKRDDENSAWQSVGQPTQVVTTSSNVVRASRRGLANFSQFALSGTCSNVSRISTRPTIDIKDADFESSMEGNNYEWSINDVPQRSLTTRRITPSIPGTYRVRVIQNGCFSDVSEVVSFTGTFIKQSAAKAAFAVDIYPNPTKGKFTIEVANATGKNSVIAVYDLLGVELFHYSFNGLSNFSQMVDLGQKQTGIYFVKVTSGNEAKLYKVVLE